MSQTAKKKTFDCIAFKRQAQSRLYEETRNMTADQQRAHLRQVVESGPLAEFWKKLKQQAKTSPKAGRM